MNSSFLLTSNKRFDGSSYFIPNEMRFSAIRLKSAIVNYSEKNIQGHQVTIRISNVASEVPTSGPQVFSIPDGHYTQQEYATTLSNILNRVKNPATDSTSLTEDNLYQPLEWDIHF